MTENRWASKLHWRRESQQTRSAKTQTALIDATEVLIVSKGTKGTSIADIAKHAGYSVGTVYHHFKDKKALLFALFDRMTREYSELNKRAAERSQWEGATVYGLISGYIDLMHKVRDQTTLSNAAITVVMTDHPELRSHISELTNEARTILLELVLERKEQINHPDPDWAAAFTIDQLGAMLHCRLDKYQRLASICEVEDHVFKREAMIFATRILGIEEETE